MAALKTRPSDENVWSFIDRAADTEKKREDSIALVKLMETVSGHPPVIWGNSIIGFGVYHYKSERSAQQGSWPLVSFSPRKAAISLYVYSGGEDQKEMLTRLGKYKMGKSCIYIKRLTDIDVSVLTEMIRSTIQRLSEKYG